MTAFIDAPHWLMSPLAVHGIKSGFRLTLTKESFVPVCQYPPYQEYRPDLREVGMLAELGDDGEIIDVKRRIFETRT